MNASSTDAQAWAIEFKSIVTDDPSQLDDLGFLIGWFANAIMAGYDEARRKYEMVNLHEHTMQMLKPHFNEIQLRSIVDGKD